MLVRPCGGHYTTLIIRDRIAKPSLKTLHKHERIKSAYTLKKEAFGAGEMVKPREAQQFGDEVMSRITRQKQTALFPKSCQLERNF